MLFGEVFPGCSAMPFDKEFDVCHGVCPRPCRETETTWGNTVVRRHEYDADGWIGSVVESGRADDVNIRCTHEDKRLAGCTLTEGTTINTVTYERDKTGRVVRARAPREKLDLEVVYANEAVVALRDHDQPWLDFTYDRQHRLVSAGGAKFVYDARGRLTERVTPWSDGPLVTHYRYDEKDRLVTVDDLDAHAEVWHMTYDAKGRISTIREMLLDDQRTLFRYEYCE